MEWDTDISPTKTGWYLCTTENSNNKRFVTPLYRNEYPAGNFYWIGKVSGEIVAVCPFPEPYMF